MADAKKKFPWWFHRQSYSSKPNRHGHIYIYIYIYNIITYIYIYIYLYITEVFGAGALGPPPTTHGGTPPFFTSRSCLESTTFSGVPLESSKCSLPPKLDEKSSQTSPQSPPNHTQMDLGGPFKTCGICDVFVTLGYMEGGWTSIWLPLAFRAHT